MRKSRSCVDGEERMDRSDSLVQVVTGFYCKSGMLFKAEVGVKGELRIF